MKTTTLSIDLLRLDGDTQNRVGINEDAVAEYAEIISEGNGQWPLPPLEVFHDGTEYFVADGFHRTLGAARAKRGSIPCTVHAGSAFDARVFGMTANDKHGLRMTRADKRKCVEWLLEQPGRLSQKKIAEMAGVSPRTVQTIVQERKPPAPLGRPEPATPTTQLAKSPPPNDQKAAHSPPQRGVVDADPLDTPEPPVMTEPQAKPNGKPPRQLDRPAWFKQWDNAIGPLVRLVDKIAREVGETGSQSHDVIQDQLQAATEEMAEWMGVQ